MKMSPKTFIPFIAVGLWLVSLMLSPGAGAATPIPPKPAPTDLILLNWADYMDPELVIRFEQKFNARVKDIYYESDDHRDSMLTEADGKGFDLVMVNGLRLDLYRRRGWLAPLNEKEIPNLVHISPKWLDAFNARGSAVPYFWGTLGVGYRKDLVPEEIRSWHQFFQPDPALSGKITMIKNARDIVGMALKALGYSANSEDSGQLAKAERLLKAQRPHVQTYTYVDLDEHSPLLTGKVVAALMYSGDALMVREYDSNIAYVVPQEGSNLWVDYLVVLSSSPNQALARAFINFLNEPGNAAQLAQHVHYATPNRAAEALLPEAFRADSVIYPDASVLDRSEFYHSLSPRVIRKYNRIKDLLVN